MHLAPACTFWLGLGMMLVEWPAMRANNALQLMVDRPLLYLTGTGLPMTDLRHALAILPGCTREAERAAGLAAADKTGSSDAAW